MESADDIVVPTSLVDVSVILNAADEYNIVVFTSFVRSSVDIVDTDTEDSSGVVKSVVEYTVVMSVVICSVDSIIVELNSVVTGRGVVVPIPTMKFMVPT